MRVLYFDSCKEDCKEFERFFDELIVARAIPDNSCLTSGSDLEILTKIATQGGAEMGFVDFFIADQYCPLGEVVCRTLYEAYPTISLYGMVPSGIQTENVRQLMQENILVSEVLCKNTPFLRSSQKVALEHYVQQSRNLKSELPPTSFRKPAGKLHLV